MNSKKIYVALFALLLCFSAFDVWSTHVIIDGDPSLEFNPIMRGLMYKFGAEEATIVSKAVVLIGMAFAIFKMKTRRERSFVMVGLLITNSFALGALSSSNLQMLLLLGW
jgi:hypothetical protein